MPITVVATMKAKPESVETVRDACKQAIEAVHSEPGCEPTRCTKPMARSCSSSSGRMRTR
jgi:hypothetical protein